MHWIGLKCEDLDEPFDGRGLIILTARDRLKAVQMLRNSDYASWTIELQRMLMLNVKAEMEVLDEMGGLSEILQRGLPV